MIARARHAVVVLVDGLPADQFAHWRPRLRTLNTLAREGLLVHRLTPPTPATSLPGRATLLTGCDTATHGVYGNNLFDGDDFRPARASDILVPSLARIATQAGRRVVGLGFGMLDPADTVALVDPWWQHKQQRGETNAKIPTIPIRHDPLGIVAALTDSAPISLSPMRTEQGRWQPDMHGLMADHEMLEMAGDLLCGAEAPDLILTEIAIPDAVMHAHGVATGAARWIVTMADLFLGRLVERLRAAGRWNDTVLAVVSDHGHGPIGTALYPDMILPGLRWATEGASLHVRVGDMAERRQVSDILVCFDVLPLPGHHLPPEWRDRIAGFAAPAGVGFERRPDDALADTKTGMPIFVSTHGATPGTPCDDAFCILAGGGIVAGELRRAAMMGFAPTLAGILGFEMGHVAAPGFIPFGWNRLSVCARS